MPSFLTLFHILLTILMLMDIVDETNWYTTSTDDEGQVLGGVRCGLWWIQNFVTFMILTFIVVEMVFMGTLHRLEEVSHWYPIIL